MSLKSFYSILIHLSSTVYKFGAESLVFQFATQKYKVEDTEL